jgi:hypothetical protein
VQCLEIRIQVLSLVSSTQVSADSSSSPEEGSQETAEEEIRLVQGMRQQRGSNPDHLASLFLRQIEVRYEEWCLLGCYAVWLL